MAKVKIYTKKGDEGKTSLIFGTRVPKDHPRIKAVGAIDELNAAIGIAGSFLKDKKLSGILSDIQNELFNIGAEIASPQKLKKRGNTNAFFALESKEIEVLEHIIDRYDEKLPTLKNFILPAGTNAATSFHLSRTIARRAEREVVSLTKRTKVNPNILKYLNRLSDLLFVFARYTNKKSGQSETTWKD